MIVKNVESKKTLFLNLSSVLVNFHPDHVLYKTIDGNMEIEFRQQTKQKESSYEIAEIMWRAPEIFQNNSKPVR